MREILTTLAELVEATVSRFATRHPGCRFALDCNADYGNVFVAVDSSPAALPIEAFFSEKAEHLFWFGDWSIPDLAWEDDAIGSIWKDRWSPHEETLSDEWLDLPEFDRAYRKKLLLQGICSIAADLSGQLSGIVPPILVADHDEHIRHTTARLDWAFRGPPSPAHALLAQGHWQCREEKLAHLLGFFHDREFVNHVVPFGDASCSVQAEGDWSLSGKHLVMTMTESNSGDADALLWQDMPYEIQRLDHHALVYREEDDTIYEYEQSSQ